MATNNGGGRLGRVQRALDAASGFAGDEYVVRYAVAQWLAEEWEECYPTDQALYTSDPAVYAYNRAMGERLEAILLPLSEMDGPLPADLRTIWPTGPGVPPIPSRLALWAADPARARAEAVAVWRKRRWAAHWRQDTDDNDNGDGKRGGYTP